MSGGGSIRPLDLYYPSRGYFTPSGAGTFTLTVSSGTVSQSTTITVKDAVNPVAYYAVSPSKVTLNYGATQVFEAIAYDSKSVPLNPQPQSVITWSIGKSSYGASDVL